MIFAALLLVATMQVDPPTPDAIAVAVPSDRPLLIEARLSADATAHAQAVGEQAKVDTALTFAHDLLTLGWARSLAPERALLGVATIKERMQVAALGEQVLQLVEPFAGPGTHHRELLPYRAAAITLLAAAGEVSAAEAFDAWRGIDLRRQGARLARLAMWAADAAGQLRAGSDRLSLVIKRGMLADTWMAQLMKRALMGQGQWPAPAEPWQVLLLAEARAHEATDAATAEALLAEALPRLVQAGWGPDEAAAVLADRMAALPPGEIDLSSSTSTARSAHAAAQVTRGDLQAWTRASLGPVAGPWTRVAARRAARGLAARNQPLDAMAAWAGAGMAGDDQAAAHAAAWALGLEAGAPDGGVLSILQAHPDATIARVVSGVQALRRGDRVQAVRDWTTVPPGTRLQAGALAAGAAQLGHVDLDLLGTSVQRLRTAAVMAATDTTDDHRAAMARQAAGWALTASVRHALEGDRVEEADRMLTLDPAVAWLDHEDALHLRAALELRRGQAEAAVAALAVIRPDLARNLLVERAVSLIGPMRGRSPDPAALDPRGLRRITGMLERHVQEGPVQDRLLVAEALRLAGRPQVQQYRDVLEAQPAWGDAMLGLAEVLQASTDEADRKEAMQLYRGIAGVPVELDPGRWWLAQLRMVQLAAQAGRPVSEVRARVQRLRHGDPSLGGKQWARAFELAVQSAN